MRNRYKQRLYCIDISSSTGLESHSETVR